MKAYYVRIHLKFTVKLYKLSNDIRL